MNQLNIHDADLATYTALAVEEQEAETTRWKSIVTPTISVVVFRPRPVEIAAEGSQA